jgi:hypothetical protein
MKRIPVIVAAALVAVIALTPAAANAAVAPPDREPLQARINAVMKANPGGVQIADDQVAWSDGDVVLTLEGGSNQRSIGSCSTGSYCAWSAITYTGIKLSFSACSLAGSSSSLAPLGTNARSLADARTTGTLKVKNGSTLVWNMAANTGIPNNTFTVTTMVCFT